MEDVSCSSGKKGDSASQNFLNFFPKYLQCLYQHFYRKMRMRMKCFLEEEEADEALVGGGDE
jgi:hypothetical protein